MDHPLTYRQRHADRGCRLRRARPGPNLPPKRPLQITPRPWRTLTKPHPPHPTHDGVLQRPLEPEAGKLVARYPKWLYPAGRVLVELVPVLGRVAVAEPHSVVPLVVGERFTREHRIEVAEAADNG